MIRYFFLVLVGVITSIASSAQELKVKSFTLAATDISAQTQQRKDLNDEPCALVKVQFVGDILNVKGNVILPLLKEDYETWVYLTHGSRQMQVTAKNHLPLMIKFADYGVESVEKNRTYVLVLSPITPSNPLSADVITIPVKNGINIEMVKVEAGTFMMGATSEMENPYDDEKPVHQVTLTKDYYIGKYEVTQALWQAVMGSNPSYFKGNNLPVEQVTWYDCQEFISVLDSITGLNFRLPTEAEWEYAARGGKKSREYMYSGSSNLSDIGWYKENSGDKTHAVGTKQANALGICDMSGNVYELCEDLYGSYPSPAQTNPTDELLYVLRGGCFRSEAWSCRSSCRNNCPPGYYSESIGFRLVLFE